MIKHVEMVEEDFLANEGLDFSKGDEPYRLFLVEEEYKEYCVAQGGKKGSITNYSNDLINRVDLTDFEYHIAKTLFMFLWYSSNGTNTCMDYEQLAEQNITKEQVELFIDRYNLHNGLDTYEEDGVEIYWDFLCRFNFKTCNFWEEK